jgi:hypothetical protein
MRYEPGSSTPGENEEILRFDGYRIIGIRPDRERCGDPIHALIDDAIVDVFQRRQGTVLQPLEVLSSSEHGGYHNLIDCDEIPSRRCDRRDRLGE